MKTARLTIALWAMLAASAFAQEGSVPKGVSHLDHVFVIVMENHGYSQIFRHWSPQFD